MGKTLDIALCVPSHRGWDEDFGTCLAKMQAFFFQHPVPGYETFRALALSQHKSSGISISRETFREQCVAKKHSHCLMIDCDQTFPPDTIHRLLFHDKPVVAANIATKTVPSAPTARTFDGTPQGKPCYSLGKHGLERVWRIGFGIMLIDVEVFKTLGDGLFEWVWNPKIKQYHGEDWTFDQHCEKHNIPIYVDHDLSNQVGHIGQYIFTHKDVLQPKELKAA